MEQVVLRLGRGKSSEDEDDEVMSSKEVNRKKRFTDWWTNFCVIDTKV